MKRVRQFAVLTRVALMLILILQSALSFADDTEIFLSRGRSDVKPNLFFILDNSGSMRNCLDKDAIPSKAAPCPNGTLQTRGQVLRDNMDKLLANMKDVRVGVIDLYEGFGGQVRIPVYDIEKVRGTARKKINKMTFPFATPIASVMYRTARYLNGYPRWKNERLGKWSDNYVPYGKDVGHNAYLLFNDPYNKKYKSPIEDACQPTHLVLLTDGEANGAAYGDISLLLNKPPAMSFEKFCDLKDKAVGRYENLCVNELVEWMHTQDQSPLEGLQTITTHTIGFGLQNHAKSTRLEREKADKIQKFLKGLAEAGGGDAYTAPTPEDLFKAFNKILEKAAKVDDATFVNPVATPTNSEKTGTDQIYYALFQPSGSDHWQGNLKRYRFGNKTVTKDGKEQEQAVIYDFNDNEAFDANGEFKANAQSFWSEAPDGPNINQGGAVYKLPEPANRDLFVETGGILGELDSSNQAISNELLKAADNNERQVLLNYIRGLTDDGSSERGKALGDFLHSAPVPFSYGNSKDDQVIIIGSNEGFVHLFNRTSGKEEWAFMPGELLKNIKKIKANEPSTKDKPHPYGVDNTVTIWQEETADKKAIKHIYAYITLRRGGRGMYALDITARGKPKLLWSIKGGEGDFKRLGQTWSQPIKRKIKIGNTPTDVLIFAGGYDATEDNFNGEKGKADGYRSDEALGNAVYIVDAKNGKKLWSASNSDSNLNLQEMTYSIPSSVHALDVDNDGLIEQLFVGDTGGQIWRLFIQKGGSGNTLVKASGADGNRPFARLGENNPKNARRFYQEPDIALDKGSQTLYVNIGSGYRAHPLNTKVEDRFYSLRTDLTSSPLVPLTEDDLHQATRTFDESFDKDITVSAINAKQGWYLPLTISAGEKVVSSSLSANDYVNFSTYVPSNSRIG